jgi:hypothetical protein
MQSALMESPQAAPCDQERSADLAVPASSPRRRLSHERANFVPPASKPKQLLERANELLMVILGGEYPISWSWINQTRSPFRSFQSFNRFAQFKSFTETNTAL